MCELAAMWFCANNGPRPRGEGTLAATSRRWGLEPVPLTRVDLAASKRASGHAWGSKPVGKLPPSINVEARGGTVILFDGRLLHGTGVNRSDRWRYVMTQANVKSWLRQQENWMLAVRQYRMPRADGDSLRSASPNSCETANL